MLLICVLLILFFFFFNDTATTEIYTLSLHDALPISTMCMPCDLGLGSFFLSTRTSEQGKCPICRPRTCESRERDRKSTRLNSSHSQISYAVFCLKKKKKKNTEKHITKNKQTQQNAQA